MAATRGHTTFKNATDLSKHPIYTVPMPQMDEEITSKRSNQASDGLTYGPYRIVSPLTGRSGISVKSSYARACQRGSVGMPPRHLHATETTFQMPRPL